MKDKNKNYVISNEPAGAAQWSEEKPFRIYNAAIQAL